MRCGRRTLHNTHTCDQYTLHTTRKCDQCKLRTTRTCDQCMLHTTRKCDQCTLHTTRRRTPTNTCATDLVPDRFCLLDSGFWVPNEFSQPPKPLLTGRPSNSSGTMRSSTYAVQQIIFACNPDLNRSRCTSVSVCHLAVAERVWVSVIGSVVRA